MSGAALVLGTFYMTPVKLIRRRAGNRRRIHIVIHIVARYVSQYMVSERGRAAYFIVLLLL